MCGFIAAKKGSVGTDEFIKRRGEDCASTLEFGGYRFLHYLLSLTGQFTPQPFVDGQIVALYNGELYNVSYTRSDGEAIIPLYKQYGENFPQRLDGEFAIALYDFASQVAIFTSDAFRTKPIYVNADGAASYPSGLAASSTKLRPNTTLVRDLRTGAEKTLPVHAFDFDHQEKTSYDRWLEAFEAAVLKRAKGKRVFIGLSSGYDSGGIHCALRKYGIEHRAFAISGSEDLDIVRARGVEPMQFTPEDFAWGREHIGKYMEDFEYHIYDTCRRIRDEESAFAMACIMRAAKAQGFRIYLSGQGADEILSDYSPWHSQSEFKGTFPEKLHPWGNFYGHCQEAYLAKEEHVGGTFSVETRYPFLDTALVQEFLWLTAALKNAAYKAPLREYMLRNGYPFAEGKKIGFTPHARFRKP